MRVAGVLLAMAVCAPALAGCGAARPAPAPCAMVVARTLRAVTARIDARAALHRRRAGRTPTLIAALTRPAPSTCAADADRTVANTVGAVGERLVGAEATGPEVRRALGLLAHDRGFVRAVTRRDRAALRARIVHFFRIRDLHIVRVRATTATGRLVGDVGGPYVLAPASRTIRGARGHSLGRVTLSVQDDAGYIKLMRRFTGSRVVLRTSSGVVPGSARVPAPIPARGVVMAGGTRYATFAFTTRGFPARRLRVALLVPLMVARR